MSAEVYIAPSATETSSDSSPLCKHPTLEPDVVVSESQVSTAGAQQNTTAQQVQGSHVPDHTSMSSHTVHKTLPPSVSLPTIQSMLPSFPSEPPLDDSTSAAINDPVESVLGSRGCDDCESNGSECAYDDVLGGGDENLEGDNFEGEEEQHSTEDKGGGKSGSGSGDSGDGENGGEGASRSEEDATTSGQEGIGSSWEEREAPTFAEALEALNDLRNVLYP